MLILLDATARSLTRRISWRIQSSNISPPLQIVTPLFAVQIFCLPLFNNLQMIICYKISKGAKLYIRRSFLQKSLQMQKWSYGCSCLKAKLARMYDETDVLGNIIYQDIFKIKQGGVLKKVMVTLSHWNVLRSCIRNLKKLLNLGFGNRGS